MDPARPPAEPASPPADTLLIETSEEFIAYVLALPLRVAVFDCDGTLWEMNSGEKFFYWSMPDAPSGRKGLVSEATAQCLRQRYAEYERGDVGEIEMCGEMVSMYEGLPIAPVKAAAEAFVASSVLSSTFPEMRELTQKLRQRGCELWAVSSSTEWLIEPGIRGFGIPADHVLATRLAVRDGIAGSELLSIPSDANKATVIAERIPQSVDAVFGNSIHDAAMLEIATHAFAVNPTPELEELAVERGWKIYWPQATRKK